MIDPGELRTVEEVSDALGKVHELIEQLRARGKELDYEPVGTTITTVIVPYMKRVPYEQVIITKDGGVDWFNKVPIEDLVVDVKAVNDEVVVGGGAATSGGPPEYTGDHLFEVPAQFVHNTNTNQIILKYDASGLERLVALMREKVK